MVSNSRACHPKEASDYIFYLNSDNGDLYLSSNESPAQQVRIAGERREQRRQYALRPPNRCRPLVRCVKPVRLEAGEDTGASGDEEKGRG